MDHTVSIDHPWRTRALAAAAIALIELVLLVGIGLALVGRALAAGVEEAAREHVITKDRPVAAQPKRADPAAPRLKRSETSVLVLNGNGQTGAAAAGAERVRALKYTVGGVGNAPSTDHGRSVVMFRPGYEGEARRLARDLRIKVVGPLDGLRLRDLMGAHVALIIGT
jgi:hypothetical protein